MFKVYYQDRYEKSFSSIGRCHFDIDVGFACDESVDVSFQILKWSSATCKIKIFCVSFQRTKKFQKIILHNLRANRVKNFEYGYFIFFVEPELI